jgi:hypothetical protein
MECCLLRTRCLYQRRRPGYLMVGTEGVHWCPLYILGFTFITFITKWLNVTKYT